MKIIFFYIFIILIYFLLLFIYKTVSLLEKSHTCNYSHNSNINNEIFIYFSHLIENKTIMLIGVSNPYHQNKITCYLFYHKYITLCNISVKKLYNVEKFINLTYIAIYISLSRIINIRPILKINNKQIPLLFYNPKNYYNIILAIVNFYQIRNYKQVIEVIEIAKLYGVEHIVIYVTSSTLFIKSILNYYMISKFVELIPFCFNSEIKFVHQKAQIEKINDVLYRYMYNTKYIIFNDIDEIIIPLNFYNYMSFLTYIDNHSSDMYLFKSKLFPYFSAEYDSGIKYKKCCFIKRGYEKYIIGNLYKYDILSVHNYVKSLFPIKKRIINVTYGYVRHTRYRGRQCMVDLIDSSLRYLDNHLAGIYQKFEAMFSYNSYLFYYGI